MHASLLDDRVSFNKHFIMQHGTQSCPSLASLGGCSICSGRLGEITVNEGEQMKPRKLHSVTLHCF